MHGKKWRLGKKASLACKSVQSPYIRPDLACLQESTEPFCLMGQARWTDRSIPWTKGQQKLLWTCERWSSRGIRSSAVHGTSGAIFTLV